MSDKLPKTPPLYPVPDGSHDVTITYITDDREAGSMTPDDLYVLIRDWFEAQGELSRGSQYVRVELEVVDDEGALQPSRLAELDGRFDLDALARHLHDALFVKPDAPDFRRIAEGIVDELSFSEPSENADMIADALRSAFNRSTRKA